MEEFATIFDNQVLLVSLIACVSAQVLKVLIELIRNGKVTITYLFTTGGMPSAHSALVGGLATSVGILTGWSSTEFAIACLFAVIVMYDAAGIRQAAGKQARVINQMLDNFLKDGKQFDEEKLRELLGHTPFQVFVGLALGIFIAFVALPIV
ncbi:MAG: divergent PAP2 family protein [Gloeocapsa sp. DLM2.Bin57]|nr:MAG: divergent PAP2 family protein [Gloeocapsa sp. DLM2.Bin57]